MTTKDEHGFPFQAEWEQHQAEPLPEFTKPKKRLPIRFNEMPPLPRKIEAIDEPRGGGRFAHPLP